MSLWDEDDPASDELVSRNAGVFRRAFFPFKVSDLDIRPGNSGYQTTLWPQDAGVSFTWAPPEPAPTNIPVFPCVIPQRRQPIPDYLAPNNSPWPLNHIPLDVDSRGYGHRPTRKVFLDCLRISGQILVPDDDPNCWDAVRVVVLFDFRPSASYPATGGLHYGNPVSDLVAPGIPLPGQYFFSSTAMSRFRVLYDHTYEIRPQVAVASTDVPERAIALTLDVPEVKPVWNPDGNSGQMVSTDNNAVTGMGVHDALATYVMAVATPGGVGTWGPAAGIPPAPLVPIIQVDQVSKPDVSRAGMLGALAGNTKTFMGIPASVIETAPVADPLPSSLAASTYVNTIQAFGQRAVNVDFEIDLLERKLFTVFGQDGRVVSGAIWLVVSSANGTAFIQEDAGSEPYLRSMLYYIAK